MGLFNRDRCEGKNPEQLAGMRTAGLLVGRTLEVVAAAVHPGMTTLDLDTLAETHIRDHGGIPNFQLVPGYRHTLCTSVNDEIVHGMPGSRVLREGDVLSIDCGAQVGLWNGDAAISVVVGGREAGSAQDLALIDDTETSLWAGIAALRVGQSLYAVGAAVEDSITASGEERGWEYGIVEDYVGHGIGTSMHMDPNVPNYRVSGKGPKVVEGTTICIEPMVTLGEQDNHVLDDQWTVATNDRSRAAHWEHSIAATSAGLCVLTAIDGGAQRLAAMGAPFAAIDDPA
jgi:methionyl aminopeptidase